jgi:serine phosphatase RsbU (regulator of sigma subunit)
MWRALPGTHVEEWFLSAKKIDDPREQLADELQNFQEIAAYLNPSPGEIPKLNGVDIAGLSLPLKRVIGGDHIIYIDFNRRYNLDRRIAKARARGREEVATKLEELRTRAGILVADVSGHRMTDALIGSMLHQAFLLGAYYELVDHGEITTRIFEHINMRFYRTTAINKFFTMIYGEITERGRFRFISAGHQPPAIFSREYGKFMKISQDRLVSFPPVGLMPSSSDVDDCADPGIIGYKKRYAINEINLLAFGDILLLLTDGLAEHDGGRFYPQVVERLLADCTGCSAADVCERLKAAIYEHAAPGDDISVVVIRRTL